MKRCYGNPVPGLDCSQLKGSLIVVEGGDGCGRSIQIALLKDLLERRGMPVVEVGLKRSQLVGPELQEAMEGNVLGPTTFGLFYATDFADQLEHSIVPALRAGFVVLADRYIYTPMVRNVARGVDLNWIREVFSFAIVPDIILYLRASPKTLAARSIQKNGALDYWESGMDIQRSGDMYECFIRYQRTIAKLYSEREMQYGFETIDANRGIQAVHKDVCDRVERLLVGSSHTAAPTSTLVTAADFVV
jgi:dTMP kinase